MKEEDKDYNPKDKYSSDVDAELLKSASTFAKEVRKKDVDHNK